jgi:hypothetical protein
MRIRPTDQLWAVVEPTADSEYADVVFPTTLAELHTLVDQRREVYAAATLYDQEEKARDDARRRILGARIAREIAKTREDLSHVTEVKLFDQHGALQLTIEVPRCS